ncbi:Ppx/GppA phosphatase family protein [Arachnia rubra]|jgi:ppx/gppA phosphatase family protein|uniref:Exopolyphosphatase n=1 Tax=Arachnia rubra TaxID=1547448 RepID=A0ABX7Y3S3_9ACTN|nr:exopolyphosphatase [Arachnia rubra]MDO4645320.1 exopolyphosphatase [Propionibacteriaceae bacterium]QUC07626.1 exopolyphosphatase [Arachnia rubra]BCR81930.1 exopolyphosphatase [Arachnia rubra]
MTVAAIDCGTNSIRLLVLAGSRDAPQELAREVRLARLGQGVDATGEFHPDALARTFAVCDEFAQIIRAHGAGKVRFVATSAARDVTNRQLLSDGVRERLGVEVDVIPGQEEARLSSSGALCAVDVTPPTLILDIGGGSTELVLADVAGTILHSVSLNVGSVRLRERFLHTDPPTSEEQRTSRAFVGDLLDGSGIDFAAVASAVGVAGTVTSVAARVLGLEAYSRDAVHGLVLGCDDIRDANSHWLATPVSEIEGEPCMHPLRAGVIGAGTLILDEIAARIPSQKILVSETDILDGIALELL